MSGNNKNGSGNGGSGNGAIQAKTVITGHMNADFDCFSAMVGASKLYPGAALAFPGSQEKSLKNFYIHSAAAMFNFVPPKKIDPASVETLVVVDTRQRPRVPHVEHILDREGGPPRIIIYDHHPDSSDDLKADESIWRAWGSCAAMVAADIRDAGLSLTEDEATAVGLGVYEDTGSFTFSSTTPEDLAAAGWLLTQGMQLEVVAELISRELEAEQVAVLNDMLEAAESFDIAGVRVLVTQVSMERYMGDFALLAQKLMDMENARVLFALARMDDRIALVARSKEPAVDVARVCARFGGGGHAFAASASVKDALPAQVKDEILSELYATLRRDMTVHTFMSSPVVSVTKDQPMEEAVEVMTRYGLKALPVLEPASAGAPQKLAGLLEHDIADKAVSHGLSRVEVREYMGRDVAALSPGDDLRKAMDVILGHGPGGRQRLAPVLENGRLVGVVTRTDLINILVREPARMPESLYPGGPKRKNVGGVLRDQLPQEAHDLLRTAGELGQRLSMQTYAVGGFVRDLILRRPNLDIDLVVEGDGIAFAQALVDELGGRIKAHPKFKTAVALLDDGRRVDVATARLEYYEYPAALPVVELSSIKMDLYRRDFTVNSLAVHLNPGKFGELQDFFGGLQDLKDKVIRVLHSLSFVEDPTRILRAVRFEQRFGFSIGGQTDRLIRGALKMEFFERLSGARIFHELELILEEAEAQACLERMAELDISRRIHPLLAPGPKQRALLEEVHAVRQWHRLLYETETPAGWRLYLLGLCDGAPDEDVENLGKALGWTERRRRRFIQLRTDTTQAMGQLHRWHKNQDSQSRLATLLRDVPVEGVLFLMAKTGGENLRKAVSVYLTRLRHIRPDVGGEDLIAMGLTPGPDFSRIINTLLAAKIDGVAECREEQLQLARQLASGQILKKLDDFKPS